jgi:hypothetical protein
VRKNALFKKNNQDLRPKRLLLSASWPPARPCFHWLFLRASQCNNSGSLYSYKAISVTARTKLKLRDTTKRARELIYTAERQASRDVSLAGLRPKPGSSQ